MSDWDFGRVIESTALGRAWLRKTGGLTMDWKAEALARARRARLQANNLRHSIDNLNYSLCKLGGYDGQCIWVGEVIKTINGIVKDLFELEGELSRTK